MIKAGNDILAQDVISSNAHYAADAGASDTYVIALPEAPTSYTDGLVVRFKANTANTGACTLNVNSLGAIAIKRPDTSDTQTGDIVANQLVEVVYRGGSFYMVSPTSESSSVYVVGALSNAFQKLYYNVHLLFLQATTHTNWVKSSSDVTIAGGSAFAEFSGTGADSIYVTSPFIKDKDGTAIQFSDSNTLIMDWFAHCATTSTGDILIGGFGSEALSFTQGYSSTSNGARVCFFQKATGELYATIAEETVGVTNTDISSGYTAGRWNNFRIELELGVQARFYVNGSLKATLSGANLEVDAVSLLVGFGRSNTADFAITAPVFSIELNP